MHSGRNHLVVASALLLLIAAPACLADLMCYVCNDCQTVDKETPLLACNEDFFNQGGSSEASTVTTTMATTLSTTEEPTTTTIEMSTTESETSTPSESTTTTALDTTTTEVVTTEPQSTESTEAPMPTPATVGPPETTTGVPTPPNEDLMRGVTKLLAVNEAPVELAELASELPIRQRRAVIDTSVSFHCYTVTKTMNDTAQTERGCSRVLASQSVCTELKQLAAPLDLSYCDPCSMNACNTAASALQTTLLSTLLIALVAVVLQHK